jgi:hypothetical protein
MRIRRQIGAVGVNGRAKHEDRHPQQLTRRHAWRARQRGARRRRLAEIALTIARGRPRRGARARDLIGCAILPKNLARFWHAANSKTEGRKRFDSGY